MPTDDKQTWVPNKQRVKTPTVIQMEAVECGAAALSIILGYYGRFVPLEQLRLDCGVSRDGSKASSIIIAAKNYGLEAQGFRYELEQISELKVPFIVFWNFNHFLVVEGFSKDLVFLNDPGTGPRTVSLDEFDSSYTGVVLTFKPTDAFTPQGKPVSIIRSLKERMVNNYDTVAFLLLTGILLVIPGLLVPTFTKVYIDNYLIGGMYTWINAIILGLIITAITRYGLTWMQNYYLARLATKLDLRDSARYFWHILHLPMSFFSQRGAGDLSNRILLNSKIATSISNNVYRTFLNIFVASFYLILMFLFTPTLTLFTLTIALINFFVLKKIVRIRRDKSLQIGVTNGQFQGAAYNGIASIETLKASGRENDFFNKLIGIQVKMVNANQELLQKVLYIQSAPMLLNGLNTVIILGLGSILIMQGHLTIGVLIAFQTLSAGFLAPINELVSITGLIQELSGDMARVDDVMVAKSLTKDASTMEKSKAHKLEGCLILDKLSFGYNVTQQPLIKDFSLMVNPGQRVALIGGSGSGKSTLAKLICRLYQPWQGTILIDNHLIESIPMIEYAGSVSLVDQEIRLFRGTIADNITMWDHSITEQDMIQAAKDACIHDIITQRDNGYDSLITEGGTNFSGGQRQRIEIARALAKNPRVLIMDEATSALDPTTEELISNNIRHRGCTCIIIAHRLSTIRDSDEIIVLDKGDVVERGSHHELVACSGHYSSLVKMEAK
jgi:NHLM bacteriocin system ABC transporter peptidase/ATP-binding protein